VARGIALSGDDIIRRAVISELMCHGELDVRGFSELHQLDFADRFDRELDRLREQATDGLVVVDDTTIRITARGRLLLRNIAMNFDAYLNNPAETSRYSRTI